MNEFELIDWLKVFFDKTGERSVPVGIGDDMAVVRVGNKNILFSSDMLVEGVHFKLPDAKLNQVGRKAIGVCLSDCAAMGGRPLWGLVSMGLSGKFSDESIKEIFVGLKSLADVYDCRIVGGDLSFSEKLVIDVALIGDCWGDKPVLRSGAHVGDAIYVTGRLGGSMLGKHFSFVPRIEESKWLVRHLSINAMIDISDGLSSDLRHICKASGCSAELYEERLERVISEEAKKVAKERGKSELYHVLNDGEDFELLMCVAEGEGELPELPEFIDLFMIGRIVSREEGRIFLVRKDGRRECLEARGYMHFV